MNVMRATSRFVFHSLRTGCNSARALDLLIKMTRARLVIEFVTACR